MIFKNTPCVVLKQIEHDTYMVMFKNEIKYLFQTTKGLGEVRYSYKNKTVIYTEYCFNDRPHRDNGPAITWGNGDRFWYNHGRLIKTKKGDY